MPVTSDQLILNLPRRLVEHPQALHVRRMRDAVWLYLLLVARLPAGPDVTEFDVAEYSQSMGLPPGTICSWLGHLRKHRYVEAKRSKGLIRVRLKRHSATPETSAPEPARFFTVAKLEHALGETGHRTLLESALAAHPDPVVRRALAGALAVPASDIRRSRTALFLYLLKRHANDKP